MDTHRGIVALATIWTVLGVISGQPQFAADSQRFFYGGAGYVRNITCRASGHPPPRIEWLLRDQVIKNNETFRIYDVGSTSHLAVAVRPADESWIFANYTCRAVNNLGQKNLQIELRKATVPGPPRAVTVTRQTSTTLELSVLPPEDNGGFDIHSYRVEYNTMYIAFFYAGDDIIVEHLEPDTTYTLVVKAVNLIGDGPGLSVTAKTKPSTPIPSAEDMSCVMAITQLEQTCSSALIDQLMATADSQRALLNTFAESELRDLCGDIQEVLACYQSTLSLCANVENPMLKDVQQIMSIGKTVLNYVCVREIEVFSRNKACLLEESRNESPSPLELINKLEVSCAIYITPPPDDQIFCSISDELRVCAKDAVTEQCGDEVADALNDLLNIVIATAGCHSASRFRSFANQREYIPATSCPVLESDDDTLVTRRGATAVVRCRFSPQVWHLICKGNRWVGQIGECESGLSRQ